MPDYDGFMTSKRINPQQRSKRRLSKIKKGRHQRYELAAYEYYLRGKGLSKLLIS